MDKTQKFFSKQANLHQVKHERGSLVEVITKSFLGTSDMCTMLPKISL